MKEEFLHFIWKNQYLQSDPLTRHGESIVVKKRGMHNAYSGPDFFDAHIFIGKQHWVGNVEIHVRSSDWNAHKHQLDAHYNNVILHVVWKHDKEVIKENGQSFPTLELSKWAAPAVVTRLRDFDKSDAYPCAGKLHLVDDFTLNAYTDRLIIERFEERNKRIQTDYITHHHNLHTSFYRLMALAFGQKINEMGFDMLSQRLPLSVLSKHYGQLHDIEALIFGVAGFLDGEAKDPYHQALQDTFVHLKSKYGLQTMAPTIWRKARLRPPNFPEVRLAQFASLINHAQSFISLLEHTPDSLKIKKLLACKPSKYWLTHYTLGKVSPERDKKISSNFVQHLIINAFAPFYFFFKRRSGGASIELMNEILSSLSAEKNAATKKMMELGFPNKNALHSQAFYHLFKNYCSHKKCLNCRIGHRILDARA